MPSPWAAVRNSTIPDTPPPDPGPWAQPDLPSALPQTPAPKAIYAPDARQQMIDTDQARLRKVQYAQDHPWGTPENHPGKLGKLAHIFSEVGNIAGNIVAPNVMANIPETQLGMKAKESQLSGKLNEELQNKSTEQEREATAAHTAAETPEIAPNAASQRALQGAQAENLESETKIREHPLPNYQIDQGMLDAQGRPVTFETHTGQFAPGNVGGLHYGRMIDRLQHVAGTLNGSPTQADFDPIRGIYTDPDTGQQIFGFKPMPQPAMQGPVMVTPQGKVIRATPGTTVPAGAMTPSQSGSVYEPTGQEKTAAGRAQIVLNQIPRTISLIDQHAQELGPAFGRWNEFMQGKGGFNAPGFALLRQDLMMMASAVALAHAVGRLPENLREEFDTAINAPQQSPENLKAVINDLRPWMNDMAGLATPGANQGLDLGYPKPNIPQAQGAAPQGADHEVYVNNKLVGHTVGGKYVPLGAH